MNPLVHWIVNGNFFFAGCAAMLISAVCAIAGDKWFRLAAGVLLAGGVVLVAASAEALPTWLYIAWAAAVAASLGTRIKSMAARPWVRWIGSALPIIAVAVAVAMALPYRVMPKPMLDRPRSVFVIGDSLSAGMGNHEPMNWPAVLTRDHGVTATNLAMPGARLSSAMDQAARITGDDCVIILEIGGNDILMGGSVAEFERDLGDLVAAVKSPGRLLVMFELPLLPLGNGFGLAQREAARRHGIILLPRRVLADVLAADGATEDGLHLSAQGDKLLADEVAGLFR